MVEVKFKEEGEGSQCQGLTLESIAVIMSVMGAFISFFLSYTILVCQYTLIYPVNTSRRLH